MKAHLLEPPFKIAWGPVLCVAAGIACGLVESYVPGQGIDVWKLLGLVMLFLFVPTGGWIALPFVVLSLAFALYEELMFWLSLRRAPHSERTGSVPGQALTSRPPIPADVPPPMQGFWQKPMCQHAEIVEI